jgi:ABC-type spermidine/putrescine transport system permease subunit I
VGLKAIRFAGSRSRGESPQRWGLLVLPAALFMVLFFAWPLVEILVQSFTNPELGLDNYTRFAGTPSGLRSLFVTLGMSGLVTLICAVVGYVYAYAVRFAPPRLGAVLLVAVIFPAGVNLLVRTFALQVVLRDTGIINQLLLRLHLASQHLTLIRTPFAVALGMTCMLLPYMVLPLYSVMRGLNPDYVQAAASLGARPAVAFFRVFLPLTLPGLYAGCLIVFVAGLGFYVVPELLGDNAGGRFLSQYTAAYMAQAEWGYGSAIGTILLLVALLTLATVARVLRVGDVLRLSFGGGR